MESCDSYRSQISLAIDDELSPEERRRFLAHIKQCPGCTEALADEQALSRMVRSSRPAISAPATLRRAVLNQLSTVPVLGQTPQKAEKSAESWLQRKAPVLSIAAALLLLVTLPLGLLVRHKLAVARFVNAAIAANHLLETGGMKLDVQSSSPAVVASYLGSRLPFPFHMPDSGIARNDMATYQLLGGSVRTFQSKPAALLAFQMPAQIVSLLIVPESQAGIISGNPIRSGHISFSSETAGDKHIVTWKDNGLIYALVVPASMAGESGCVACHRTGRVMSTSFGVPHRDRTDLFTVLSQSIGSLDALPPKRNTARRTLHR